MMRRFRLRESNYHQRTGSRCRRRWKLGEKHDAVSLSAVCADADQPNGRQGASAVKRLERFAFVADLGACFVDADGRWGVDAVLGSNQHPEPVHVVGEWELGGRADLLAVRVDDLHPN